MLNIIGAIISGLIIGALARFFYPGAVVNVGLAIPLTSAFGIYGPIIGSMSGFAVSMVFSLPARNAAAIESATSTAFSYAGSSENPVQLCAMSRPRNRKKSRPLRPTTKSSGSWPASVNS